MRYLKAAAFAVLSFSLLVFGIWYNDAYATEAAPAGLALILVGIFYTGRGSYRSLTRP